MPQNWHRYWLHCSWLPQMYFIVLASSFVGVLDQIVTHNEKFPFSAFWCFRCEEKGFRHKKDCKVRTSFVEPRLMLSHDNQLHRQASY